MTDCQHPNIQTWYAVDTRKPAGMWSCIDCNIKFVPLTELMNDIAAEREACARVCEELADASNLVYAGVAATHCADAIRARGQV